MSDKDSGKIQKADCRDQKGCCPSPSDTTKPQPPHRQPWWKIAALALAVLIIAGAASYYTIRYINASGATLDRSNIPQIGASRYIPDIFGMGELVWVQNLSTTFIEHDFIFVMLPDNDIKLTKTLAKRISDAAAKIEVEGTRVDTITLSPDDPEFLMTMRRMALGQVPTVLAISSSGNGAIITGDITEKDILQTYLGVVEPPICDPSGGCCGGDSASSGCGE